MAMIAASTPNKATKDALKDALKVPSAQSYFDDTASEQARSSGELSQREFESFEVGRRYANTAYLSDLQQMEGDNLIREQIRVQNLGNWLRWPQSMSWKRTIFSPGRCLPCWPRSITGRSWLQKWSR